jgi:uncharacterized membrane protein
MAYLTLKLLHVLSAILAFGASLTYSVWALRGLKEPQHEGFALRGIQWLDTWLVNPAFTVAGLSGWGLVWLYQLPLGLAWVWGSLALWAFSTLLAWGLYRPLARRQWAAFERGGAQDADYQRLSLRAARLGVIFTAANVGLVLLMVFKPAGQ